MGKEIFVFGSNLGGFHGAGSALEAYKSHGAVNGRGIGIQGNSYALPTKNRFLNTLPINVIKIHVDNFIEYADNHPDETFKIVAIGCGLAGYTPSEIGPLFHNAPENCILPIEFQEYAA